VNASGDGVDEPARFVDYHAEVRFVDSHAHVADAEFDGDRTEVLDRARRAGCDAVVCIATATSDARLAASLADEHRGFVFATVGVHPHEASSFDPHRDPELIREGVAAGAVAIGECGLDYHYEHAPRDVQRRVFSAQIELAAQLRRPVVVHSRDALDDTLAALREADVAGTRGVLHCFTGPSALAERALESGWFVSFAGIVTFRKWTDDGLIRAVPEDRLLVESDAPYLAPVPFRGKRNEPAHVLHTVGRVAAARGVPPAMLGAAVRANASRCFGLALAESSV
jgi:TatD DNase family protein